MVYTGKLWEPIGGRDMAKNITRSYNTRSGYGTALMCKSCLS